VCGKGKDVCFRGVWVVGRLGTGEHSGVGREVRGGVGVDVGRGGEFVKHVAGDGGALLTGCLIVTGVVV